jgi:hypothetical protein
MNARCLWVLLLAGCSAATSTAPSADAGSTPEPTADGGVYVPPGCQGVALTQDGVVDLDLRTVDITGHITLRGVQGVPTSRQIAFERVDTHARGDVQLESDGAYHVLLSPGHYRVFLNAPNTCLNNTVPCSAGVLMEDVNLGASGVLDLEVPLVRVTWQVTFNGTPAPTVATALGNLLLTPEAGGDAVALAVGRPSQGVSILPGRYVASFSGAPTHCGTRSPDGLPVPCGEARLRTLDLTADGSLTMDVPSVTVQGALNVDGGGTPPSGTSLSFSSETASTTAQPQGNQYSVILVPGSYDVRFNGNSQCNGNNAWPCNSGTVMEHVSLTANGQLDVQVQPAHVSGNLTVDGNTVNQGAGSVEFSNAQGSVTVEVSGSRYSATLLAGSYNVSHVASEAACQNTECGRALINKGVMLSGQGALDLSVSTVNLVLHVNYQGQVMDLRQGASVTVVNDDGLALTWETSGSSRRLAKGKYSVRYQGGACGEGERRYPCGNMVLASNVEVTADGALDLNVDGAAVQYHLMLNGGGYPSGAGASLLWLPPDRPSEGATLNGAAGSGSLLLPKASYVVAWAPGSSCGALTQQGLPCVTRVLLGCE